MELCEICAEDGQQYEAQFTIIETGEKACRAHAVMIAISTGHGAERIR